MDFKIRSTEKKDLAFFQFWTEIADEREKKWYMTNDWNMLFTISKESPDLHLITVTSHFSDVDVANLMQERKIPLLDFFGCENRVTEVENVSHSVNDEERDYPWLCGAMRTPDGRVVESDIVAKKYLRKDYISDEAEEKIIKRISRERNPYGDVKNLPWQDALSGNDFKSDSDDIYWLPVAHISIYYDIFSGEAEIDLIVSPFMRNAGLGENVIRQVVSAEDMILGTSDAVLWSAEIDISNVAAKKCFENAGFTVDRKNYSCKSKERYIYKNKKRQN